MYDSLIVGTLLLSVFGNVLSRYFAFPAIDALTARVRAALAGRAQKSLERNAPAKERFETAVTTLLNDPRAETRARSEGLRLLIVDSVFLLASIGFAIGTFVFDSLNQKALAAVFYLAMLTMQLMLFLHARRRFRLEAILREVSKRVGMPL